MGNALDRNLTNCALDISLWAEGIRRNAVMAKNANNGSAACNFDPSRTNNMVVPNSTVMTNNSTTCRDTCEKKIKYALALCHAFSMVCKILLRRMILCLII